jgi:cellulose synthase/poly-beta-1,6-N-acetylglucosamine synthase-like glycosyltransferase
MNDLVSMETLRLAVSAAADLSLWYLGATSAGYGILLLLSLPELWKHWTLSAAELRSELLTSDALPPITIMAPAHNESATIVDSTMSFLGLHYPSYELIIVNDDSKDDTLERLIAAFQLYSVPPAVRTVLPTVPVRGYYRSRIHAKLFVIDKENGGKADALNAALNAARSPYVLAVDADTILDPDALLRLSRPFSLGEPVAAVGGALRVANGCRVENGRVVETRVHSQWMTGCQSVEYLRAFLFGRLGWNRVGGNLIISGAFGLFRRDHLMAIGGYRTSTVGEDMDLVIRLRRYLYEHKIPGLVPFVPDSVAWTEVPSTLKVLGAQRERWQRGLVGTMVANSKVFLNPRYGAMGMIAYPWFVFAEMIAPLAEAVGWALLALALVIGAADWHVAVAFVATSTALQALLSLVAILLEELTFRAYADPRDVWRLCGRAFAEAFGFRQLLIWFRLKGMWRHLGGELGWGRMQRVGFRST